MADRAQYIDSIKVLNERLLAQLDEEKSKIDKRKANAQREIAQCALDEDGIEEKRKAILQAQTMQLAYLDSLPPDAVRNVPPPPPGPPPVVLPPVPPPPPSTAVPQTSTNQPEVLRAVHVAAPPVSTGQPGAHAVGQRRARVGPQRYFILISLRAAGALTLADVTKRTGLPERRVRDQLRSDIHDGVVDEVLVGVVHKYRLSKAGDQLLSRFEEYRKSSGKGLPTMEDVRSGNTPASADIFS